LQQKGSSFCNRRGSSVVITVCNRRDSSFVIAVCKISSLYYVQATTPSVSTKQGYRTYSQYQKAVLKEGLRWNCKWEGFVKLKELNCEQFHYILIPNALRLLLHKKLHINKINWQNIQHRSVDISAYPRSKCQFKPCLTFTSASKGFMETVYHKAGTSSCIYIMQMKFTKERYLKINRRKTFQLHSSPKF